MGREELNKFTRRWQQTLYVEGALYAIGFGGLIYLSSKNFLLTLLALGLALLVYVLLKKPWKISTENAVAFVDAHVPQAGYSSGLLMMPHSELNEISKLQRHRVSEALRPVFSTLRPPHNLFKAAIIMFGLILMGLAIQFGVKDLVNNKKVGPSQSEIQFAPLDSLESTEQVPKLTKTSITIQYPAYTGKSTRRTTDPNINAVEGSTITWQLDFDGEVSEVILDRVGELYPLEKKGSSYLIRQKLESSGFYSFSFSDTKDHTFVTDMYSMEVIKDEPPLVEVEGLDQYSYFEYDQVKQLPLFTHISDDFGINNAFIVATVSKGSGESVKFREETLQFDGTFSKGNRQLQLHKNLDLDALQMDPGDELYFYVEVEDNKAPIANISRSETYFAVIRDTISDAFGVEGTLGVDLMPDYFRSQRQLIIDTEKLIKDKPKLTEYDFKFKSNELGFDQKSLRLKYGQFMGDETEMQNAPGQVNEVDEEHTDEVGEEGEEDLLEGYSHKHDSDNEHNLVAEHEEESEEEAEDPLHDYVHNHEDPEASTLFEKSLKAKLRDALSIMWDAELYLRLYQPEKSLPYQYQALKLIQEIKNSARIYVHRIGFDPPPIKEEKRLTGDIKDISNFNKKEQFDYQMSFLNSRRTISRLELLIQDKDSLTQSDLDLFQNAGNELANEAIANPLKYLKVLQGLRDLNKTSHQNPEAYQTIRKELSAVLPPLENNPGKGSLYQNEIDAMYLKALENYD